MTMNLTEEAWEKAESITFSSKNFLDTVGYTRASHLVTLSSISDGAYRTYILIRGFAMHGQEMTWGLSRLAILRGVNRSTLTRHLAELCQFNLITREQRFGKTTVTHFPTLEEVFPELAAQCLAAALWKQVRGDEDLRELVAEVGRALDPNVAKLVTQVTNNEAPSVAILQHEEEEEKKKKLILPAPQKSQGTEGYFSVTSEPEYVDVEEEEAGTRPKWQVPDNKFQRDFLAVCGAKRFKSKQKTAVKKLTGCLAVGATLTDAACFHRCLDELRDCENFPDRKIAMPISWLSWRSDHAKSNRWSVQGFINSLFDRDALVRHCQVMLKRMGAAPSAADIPVPEGMVRLVTEGGVKFITKEEAVERLR